MSDKRLPKQLLFGWLPQTRPAEGPRLRWKDRVNADLRQLQVSNDWFERSQDRPAWREVCHTLPTPAPPTSFPSTICHRVFKSKAGLSRHKCAAERQLPVRDQPGALQCPKCLRWFRSPGGLAVHKCRPVEDSQPVAPSSFQSDRSPITNQSCCPFHCSSCSRCFRSHPGFRHHNCQRGIRAAIDRSAFLHQCGRCGRRFRFPRDQARHKCLTAEH